MYFNRKNTEQKNWRMVKKGKHFLFGCSLVLTVGAVMASSSVKADETTEATTVSTVSNEEDATSTSGTNSSTYSAPAETVSSTSTESTSTSATTVESSSTTQKEADSVQAPSLTAVADTSALTAEEISNVTEAIKGSNVEIIYSTFDELPEHHKRVSEMTIERAKRLVEHKKDVTIFIDSITRLARAYNLTVPPSGRTLSGGLDPAALHMPKRFFGAARNMREGGSLTILATALVDTGSKMDDVVYEEFKGTGNMELVLNRKLQEKRIFPAIDIAKSGTRREDLLLSKEELEAVDIMRKALNGMKSDEALENILNMFAHTKDNKEFVQTVKKQRFLY